jgi:hypothetical protein
VRYTDNSDLLVKVVHVNDTTRVSLLSDNTKSIRSATWDPTGKYLVRALLPCSHSGKEWLISDNSRMRWKDQGLRYVRTYTSLTQNHRGGGSF